jgi:hypothetical protein
VPGASAAGPGRADRRVTDPACLLLRRLRLQAELGRGEPGSARIYSITFDTIGWYGRSVADLDLLAEVYGIGEPQTAPASIRGLRVALCRSPEWAATEPPMREAFAKAEHILSEAGATLKALELPEPFAKLTAAHKVILFLDGRANLSICIAHIRVCCTTNCSIGSRIAIISRIKICSPPTISRPVAARNSMRSLPALM